MFTFRRRPIRRSRLRSFLHPPPAINEFHLSHRSFGLMPRSRQRTPDKREFVNCGNELMASIAFSLIAFPLAPSLSSDSRWNVPITRPMCLTIRASFELLHVQDGLLLNVTVPRVGFTLIALNWSPTLNALTSLSYGKVIKKPKKRKVFSWRQQLKNFVGRICTSSGLETFRLAVFGRLVLLVRFKIRKLVCYER